MIKDMLTQSDNQTFCAIRVLGFIGVGIVATAVVIGSAPAEAGIAIAAIITSIGGSLRLKGAD